MFARGLGYVFPRLAETGISEGKPSSLWREILPWIHGSSAQPPPGLQVFPGQDLDSEGPGGEG